MQQIISPSYFVQLAERIDNISGVDILVKNTTDDNEPSRYRYEVVIYKNASKQDVTELTWHQFKDNQQLQQLLTNKQNFAISNYPNGRVYDEIELINLFDSETIEKVMRDYKRLLEQLVERQDLTIGEIKKRVFD